MRGSLRESAWREPLIRRFAPPSPTGGEGRKGPLLLGSLRLRNPRRRGGRDERRRLQHRRPERRRDRHAEWNQHAGSRDRHERDLDPAFGGEIFDHGAIGDVARDRREVDGADQRGPVIALLGLHRFHALVVELEVVAQAAVEDRLRRCGRNPATADRRCRPPAASSRSWDRARLCGARR